MLKCKRLAYRFSDRLGMASFGSFPELHMRRCPFCAVVMIPTVRMVGTNTLYCASCGKVLPV